MRKTWLITVLLAATAVVAPAQAAGPAPDAVVTAFHDGLLASMKQGKNWDCKTRNAQLAPLISKTFDFPYLAQKILRKRWKDLSATQQVEFINTFRDLVTATYASNFNSFGGESFDAGTAQDAPGGMRMVKTHIAPKNRDPVPLDYVLRQDQERWSVVNVIAAGVSDFSLRSAQYEGVFKQKGYEGLIQNLLEQTAKLQQGC